MSFAEGELPELFNTWNDLNISGLLENISHVELHMCHTAFNRTALLHAMCTLYIFIFVIGLAANALVVWVNVRAKHHQRRHGTHLYILNLAVADLSVVATLPVWVSSLVQGGVWSFGEAACKLTHLVFSVNLFASIFFLTCMSVDRYLSVATRLCELSSRRWRLARCVACAGSWLLALVASVPDTYFLQAVTEPHSKVTQCQPVYPEDNPHGWMVGVQISFVILGFAVPFPIITVSYALLARALASSSSSSSSPSSSSATDQERNVSRKVILTYIVVFLACWAPYHAVLLADAVVLLGALPLSCRAENALYVAMHLTQCLSLLHCCVNPVVYSFVHRHYRYDLMKAFIFKYSTRTGLAHLMDASQGTETEYSAVENPPVVATGSPSEPEEIQT
ncbi:atypical chemokine receptor 3a [Chanos chanos]|uniref:Atypical chemokine receptor 3a n=1 Tax=Chanos chanos TaxID=29144 RepID=A0A6J2WF26_CHACN|nr:atypical chemokine receptor 3-like [Chanos chanos]